MSLPSHFGWGVVNSWSEHDSFCRSRAEIFHREVFHSISEQEIFAAFNETLSAHVPTGHMAH